MKTIEEQIKSAKRELALRKRVYGKLIKDEKMTADEARHEIECMEAIVETLESRNDQLELSMLERIRYSGRDNPNHPG